MKEKIFNALKQEYKALGLSDEIIQGYASALAAIGLVTDENLNTIVSAQKDFLTGLQSGIDKRVTSAREKALADAKKAEDEAKAKTEAEKKQAEEDAKKADADKDKSDWQKVMEKQFEEFSKKDGERESEFKTLKEKYDALEKEKAETTRTSTILSKAKELGIPEWRIKEGFAVPNPENNISTYTVRLVNPGGNIDMIDSDDKKTKQINLNDPSKNLTTGNSARTVKLAFLTANVQGSYLEVCLGNIVKRVPIGVLSSNSYLMDFASSTEQTMYIPIAQANMDGVERIAISDALTPIIVWSDQDVASSDLEMIYDKDKQWIKITNKTAFSGNVVVAVTLNDVIKWSWHIWSMDNTVLTFNPKMNIYDFKPEHKNEYNGFTFMDRNLGAYTLAKDGRISDWGLMYQFGRKDPFPGAQSGTPPLVEQTIYYNNQSFTLSGNHPALGSCNVTSISADNLEYSIQHPIRFIKGMVTGSGADWRTNDSSSDHYEWLTADREKAVYNPCPIGWTLPYGGYVGPWHGIHISHATIEVNGLTFNDAGYYPFVPCREGENGTLNFHNNVSNSGLSLWWGNNNDDNISSTDFRNYLIMNDPAPRSGGLHVRCVREKQLIN